MPVVVYVVTHDHARRGHRWVGSIEDRVRHESEDMMEGYSTDQGEPVDVAEMHLPAQEEKSAKKEEEEYWAEKIRVIHDVLIDASHGVEDCQGLVDISKVQYGWIAPRSPSNTVEAVLIQSNDSRSTVRKKRANLSLYMPKIDPQLFQQRRLPFISFRSKSRQPARPQASLLAHTPTDTLTGLAKARRGHEACRSAISSVSLIALLLCTRAVQRAISGLRGSGMTRYGGRVGRGVELEVLGRVGGWLLLRRVELAHLRTRFGGFAFYALVESVP